MVTSAIIHKVMKMINVPVDIRNVCVLLAPGFSALTALATYLFTREMSDDGAGLLAAAFIGIAPGITHLWVGFDHRLYFPICCWIV